MFKILTTCLIVVVYFLPTPILAQGSFGGDENWSPLFGAPSPVLYPSSIQTSKSHLFVSGSLISPDNLDIVSGTLYRRLEDTDVRYLDIVGWESATFIVGENRLFAWKGEYTGELAEIDLEARTAVVRRSPRGIKPRFKIYNEELYALSFSDSVRVVRLGDAEWESLGPAIPDLKGGVIDWVIGEDGVYVVYGNSALCEVSQCETELWKLNGRAWSRSAVVKSPNIHGIARIAQDDKNRLIIIGAFSEVNGIQANWVARWDGNQWSALDEGMPDDVKRLVTIDTRGDQIYLSSDAGHVLEWNGFRWNVLGRADQIVFDLEVREDKVYTAGQFAAIDDVITHKVAEWHVEDETWSSIFSSAGEGVEGQVRTLAVSQDGTLIVGGIFNAAGSTVVDNIARWDGGRWWPVGDGLDAAVDVLIEEDGMLYAGTEDGVAVYGQDQDIWTYLKNPNAGIQIVSVSDLVMFKNSLYVKAQNGETFDRGLFRWNGNVWDAFGNFEVDGQTGRPERLATDGDNVLFVSGFFDHIDGVHAQNLAAWDGSEWSSLGSELVTEATALAVSDDKLYIGSWTFSDVSFNGSLLVWDAQLNTWDSIPFPEAEFDSCEYSISALLPREDGLYTGLGLECVVPLKKSNEWSPLLRWNGTSWDAPGSGISNGSVRDLVDNGEDVYAGGSFSAAGGQSSLGVAHWNESIRLTSMHVPEEHTLIGLHQNYPNPFAEQTTVSFTLESSTSDLQLEVYDLLGRKVKLVYTGPAESGTHQVRLSAADLASGIYIYRLKLDEQTISRKMMILK